MSIKPKSILDQDREMKVEMMDISLIEPYENNPRFNEASVDAVAESIRRFGWKQPIVVDAEGVIIAGHTRYKAAKKLGMMSVPVLVADDLTDEEVKAYRLADNKVGEQSLWDFQKLDEELASITDIDMGDFGFSDIEDLNITDEDDGQPDVEEVDVPEPPAKPRSKRGQVYRLGRHRLMCGDSTSSEDMSKLMDGTKADISFTSPPYNAHHLDIEIDGKMCKMSESKYKNDEDLRTDDEYIGFLDQSIQTLLDNSKEVFFNIGLISGSKRAVVEILHRNLDRFKDLIYWQKSNSTPVINQSVISSATELIIAFGENNTRAFNREFGYWKGIIEGPSASSSNEYADIHKATFPMYLPTEIITRFTDRDASVLDAFGGTGTTLIACEQTERSCYMMEIDPTYVDVIIKRWEDFTGQKAELISG